MLANQSEIIRQALVDSVTELRQVRCAVDMGYNGALARSQFILPSCYVIEEGLSAEPLSKSKTYFNVSRDYAVVVAISSTMDEHGQDYQSVLLGIRYKIIKTLLSINDIVNQCLGDIVYRGGQLLGYEDSIVLWRESFVISNFLEIGI